ncbi:anthranilate synthase component I [Microcoleus sp. FACHB-68]|uniref:anthranilate synthase component I n=1 Tax=Microcoleus sp. FACHB-68 TaxID=2692826 RepID=UPI001683661C|nr:anthranilate synthase component I [Microcoleus sp. FACHB-68]MBD1939923.1 anthranilate synthase component I [Microcoleus sp. FACHB-68]
MQPIQPWYWRKIPLNNRTGSEVFDTLFRISNAGNSSTNAIATLLESPYIPNGYCQPLTRYSICAGAPRIVEGQLQMWTPAVGEILPFLRRQLQRATNSELTTQDSELPFTGGWLGWLGYDLAKEIERLPDLKPDPLPFPVAYWYEPASFAVLDHHEQTLWLAASDAGELDRMQGQVEKGTKAEKGREGEGEKSLNSPMPAPKFQMSQAEYQAAVLQAQKYIRAGDIFQANLSLRFETRTNAESWSIYRALQQINPSPFASYWQTPWGDMISCSPERLVQLQNRQAQTRPIAGTRSRGSTPALDEQLAKDLLANIKEQAEHIMLVDLERNDLGRVCEWGSVFVDELLTIERYSHVMHLVSNVIGTMQPNCDAVDLIRAMFPGGTITGCPKVRCMEIIEELEPVRRNLFYGSCGYLDWQGNLDLNILIRTLLFTPESSSTQHSNIVWGQVGAGIVADSDPEKEWGESLQKAKAQLAALKQTQIYPP